MFVSSKLFRKCSWSFKRDVALIMDQILILAGSKRQCEHGLFYVKLGIVRVSKAGGPFMRKFAGDLIGEDSFSAEPFEWQVRLV
jgi:hypothetical protein